MANPMIARLSITLGVASLLTVGTLEVSAAPRRGIVRAAPSIPKRGRGPGGQLSAAEAPAISEPTKPPATPPRNGRPTPAPQQAAPQQAVPQTSAPEPHAQPVEQPRPRLLRPDKPAAPELPAPEFKETTRAAHRGAETRHQHRVQPPAMMRREPTGMRARLPHGFAARIGKGKLVPATRLMETPPAQPLTVQRPREEYQTEAARPLQQRWQAVRAKPVQAEPLSKFIIVAPPAGQELPRQSPRRIEPRQPPRPLTVSADFRAPASSVRPTTTPPRRDPPPQRQDWGPSAFTSARWGDTEAPEQQPAQRQPQPTDQSSRQAERDFIAPVSFQQVLEPAEGLEVLPDARLISKPLSEVTATIEADGRLPEDQAAALFAGAGAQHHTTGFSRPGGESQVFWDAPALSHFELLFEDANLERHGHSAGAWQPLLSAAHFFGRVPAIPYLMSVDGRRECHFTLGHFRPGSCAPYQIYLPPVSLRGAAAETTAALGLFYLLP